MAMSFALNERSDYLVRSYRRSKIMISTDRSSFQHYCVRSRVAHTDETRRSSARRLIRVNRTSERIGLFSVDGLMS